MANHQGSDPTCLYIERQTHDHISSFFVGEDFLEFLPAWPRLDRIRLDIHFSIPIWSGFDYPEDSGSDSDLEEDNPDLYLPRRTICPRFKPAQKAKLSVVALGICPDSGLLTRWVEDGLFEQLCFLQPIVLLFDSERCNRAAVSEAMAGVDPSKWVLEPYVGKRPIYSTHDSSYIR